MHPFQLDELRAFVTAYCEALRDRDGPYGAYRGGPRNRADLYSSTDVAIMRAVMGEDLLALPPRDRKEWVAHINSFAEHAHGRATDGSYSDTWGHSRLHANGMVISALGVLGGRQRFPVKLYEAFNTPAKVPDFLETIDWAKQWSASHLFWGGLHCYSFSKHCTPAWFETVFAWLNANLDEQTGWWRKGVAHSDRNQPLGGSVHIVPIYEHHQRPFPAPERVIDSVLALQGESGAWLKPNEFTISYLELDALYAFRVMSVWAPNYRRGDMTRSVDRFGALAVEYLNRRRAEMLNWHPHHMLAVVGAFGLLQQLAPEQFVDRVRWTDIFSDRRLYQTAQVEAD